MKYQGLARLVDTARDITDPRGAHYPVKRKGERRRLNPNLDAIRWLEGEAFQTDTEIARTYDLGEFTVHRALGWSNARRMGMYPWPMFQAHSSFKAHMLSYDSCPDCDNWAYTSRCTKHHDRDGIAGLVRGAHRRAERQDRRREERADPCYDDLLQAYRQAFGTLAGVRPNAADHFTLEITSDTVQAPSSTVRIEVEADGGPQA